MAVREPRLRWPIPARGAALAGRTVRAVSRRGKYLLLDCGDGHLILHLGMSGSLRLVPPGTHAGKHDHFDLAARRSGPAAARSAPLRRGAVDHRSAEAHPLLAHLGVEPLSRALNGARLHALTRASAHPIKQFLMDGQRIVGVGNIYASESLFRAGIDPRTRAGRISPARGKRLVSAIKATLRAAISAGGSSLRDFVGSDGAPGYFQQRAWVYDRAGGPAGAAARAIRRIVQGQRSTYFCPAASAERLAAEGLHLRGEPLAHQRMRRTSTRRRPARRSRAPASPR